MTWKDVVYVPDCRDILMSVRKLISNGAIVIFDETGAHVEHNGEVIARGEVRNGVHWVKILVRMEVTALSKQETNLLWHRLLVLLSMKNVCVLFRKSMVKGIAHI